MAPPAGEAAAACPNCNGLPAALAYALLTHMNYVALTRLRPADPLRKWTAVATLVFLFCHPLATLDATRPITMFVSASATFMLTLRVYDVYFTRPGSAWTDVPYGRYLVEMFSFPAKVLTGPTASASEPPMSRQRSTDALLKAGGATPEPPKRQKTTDALLKEGGATPEPRRRQKPADALLKAGGAAPQMKLSRSSDCLQRKPRSPASLALQFLGGIGYHYLAHVALVFIPTSSEVLNEKSWTKSFINYTCMGVAFYCALSAVANILSPVLYYLGHPQLPVFNRPLLSTSPKMFWSECWNMAVKSLLHRVVFNMRNRRLVFATSEQRQRMSNLEKAFWAMVVFVVSGLYHEYVTFVSLGLADGWNMAFFVLHGTFTIAQVLAQKKVPALRNVPTWVAYPLNVAFFVATVPLFFRVYVRGRVFEIAKVDNPIYDLAARAVAGLARARAV